MGKNSKGGKRKMKRRKIICLNFLLQLFLAFRNTSHPHLPQATPTAQPTAPPTLCGRSLTGSSVPG